MTRRPDYSEYLTPAQLAVEEVAWAREMLYERNAAVVNAYAPKSVVEVGPGGGFVARELLTAARARGDSDFEYIAIDKNERCLAMTQRRCWDEGTYITADVRSIGGPAAEPSDWRAEGVACFAVLKHFAPDEWSDVFRKVLTLGRRFAFFDLLVSASGQFEDNGTDWPHTWAPLPEVLACIAGWSLLSYRIVHSEKLGVEVLCAIERRPA